MIDDNFSVHSRLPVEYVQRFATKEAIDATDKGKEDEDEEMSDVGSISEEGDDP